MNGTVLPCQRFEMVDAFCKSVSGGGDTVFSADDSSGAVEEAYAYGRTGTQDERDEAYQASKTQPYNIAVLPYLNLKTDNIRKFLTDKAGNSGSTEVSADTYQVGLFGSVAIDDILFLGFADTGDGDSSARCPG